MKKYPPFSRPFLCQLTGDVFLVYFFKKMAEFDLFPVDPFDLSRQRARLIPIRVNGLSILVAFHSLDWPMKMWPKIENDCVDRHGNRSCIRVVHQSPPPTRTQVKNWKKKSAGREWSWQLAVWLMMIRKRPADDIDLSRIDIHVQSIRTPVRVPSR